MNVQFANERPVSEIQEERKTLEQEKEALQERIVQLTEDRKNLMLAVTDLYEMVLPLLPE